MHLAEAGFPVWGRREVRARRERATDVAFAMLAHALIGTLEAPLPENMHLVLERLGLTAFAV